MIESRQDQKKLGGDVVLGGFRHSDHINLFGDSDMTVKTVYRVDAKANGLQNLDGKKRGAKLYLVLGERTGWALHASDGQISSGVREFHHDSCSEDGSMFMDFLEWLRQVHRDDGPLVHVVYKEERRDTHWPIDGKKDGFLWHLDIWVKEHDIFLIGVTPVTIKLGVTDRIDASEQQMAQAVNSRGWHAEDHAEIEALAMMLGMEAHPVWGGNRMIAVYTDVGKEMRPAEASMSPSCGKGK